VIDKWARALPEKSNELIDGHCQTRRCDRDYTGPFSIVPRLPIAWHEPEHREQPNQHEGHKGSSNLEPVIYSINVPRQRVNRMKKSVIPGKHCFRAKSISRVRTQPLFSDTPFLHHRQGH
jgi:hypothetical protein